MNHSVKRLRGKLSESKYRRKLSFYRKYRNYRSPCHACGFMCTFGYILIYLHGIGQRPTFETDYR